MRRWDERFRRRDRLGVGLSFLFSDEQPQTRKEGKQNDAAPDSNADDCAPGRTRLRIRSFAHCCSRGGGAPIIRPRASREGGFHAKQNANIMVRESGVRRHLSGASVFGSADDAGHKLGDLVPEKRRYILCPHFLEVALDSVTEIDVVDPPDLLVVACVVVGERASDGEHLRPFVDDVTGQAVRGVFACPIPVERVDFDPCERGKRENVDVIKARSTKA